MATGAKVIADAVENLTKSQKMVGKIDQGAKALTHLVTDGIKGNGSFNKLNSNKAINPLSKTMNGLSEGYGLPTVAKSLRSVPDGGSYTQALKEGAKAAYTTTGKDGKTALNMTNIAGSYLTVAAGARIATGGGVYRDNNGRTNLMGVPFI